MAEPRKYEIRGLKGTPNYPIGTDRKILLALEDTGYAFNFYKDYAHRNYSIPEADIIGVGGADNFPNVLRTEIGYDAYIIVYDNGAEKKKLDSIADALDELRENTSAPIYSFTPKCFEEVLLSFTYLADYVKTNHNTLAYEVFNKLQGILNGDSDINYFTIKNEIMSEEKKIEKYLEELTKDTAWVYKHGERDKKGSAVMSPCWVQNCCFFDKTKENGGAKKRPFSGALGQSLIRFHR